MIFLLWLLAYIVCSFPAARVFERFFGCDADSRFGAAILWPLGLFLGLLLVAIEAWERCYHMLFLEESDSVKNQRREEEQEEETGRQRADIREHSTRYSYNEDGLLTVSLFGE